MKRLHLIEIEDQNWCPSIIRDGITDFLQFIVYVFHLYRPVAERLSKTFEKLKTVKIIDLCSGGGGPWLRMMPDFPKKQQQTLHLHLTDLYPNIAAFDLLATNKDTLAVYHPESVSALDVPDELNGFRTLFSSFHHFKPDQAKKIIADAIEKNQGIAIFESTQRHILLIIYMLFIPVIILLVTPFIRPFKWSRLLFTYFIPVIPLAIMFDGIVSCLRTYTPEELSAMVNSIEGSEQYHWDIGLEKISPLPIGVTYLIGYPKYAQQRLL